MMMRGLSLVRLLTYCSFGSCGGTVRLLVHIAGFAATAADGGDGTA